MQWSEGLLILERERLESEGASEIGDLGQVLHDAVLVASGFSLVLGYVARG